MITPSTDNKELKAALYAGKDDQWDTLIATEWSIVDCQTILSRNTNSMSSAQKTQTTRLLHELIEDRDYLIVFHAEQAWLRDPQYKDISQFDKWQRISIRLRALTEPLSQLSWMDYFVDRDRRYLSSDGI